MSSIVFIPISLLPSTSLLTTADSEPQAQPSDAMESSSGDNESRQSTAAPSQQVTESKVDLSNDQEANTAASSVPAAAPVKEPEWAHGVQLATILVAVTLVTFLMLLDGTIVVAAVPYITDQFDSLNDIGWYGAAYQLGRYATRSFESCRYCLEIARLIPW